MHAVTIKSNNFHSNLFQISLGLIFTIILRYKQIYQVSWCIKMLSLKELTSIKLKNSMDSI